MLPSLIDTYCVHLEAEGRSPKTIAWHRASLEKYSAWLREAGNSESPTDWTAHTIRAYFVALKKMTKADGQPLTATSISTYARSLRAFCRWLHVEEREARNG
ncbi:MAG: integrase/recombinase XerD [Thermomicrobiales bacterium]|jgi:site-specific recombinase XerD|nr:integrase/recombinase XerD [Thermomicrobiales bacterium]